MLKATRRQRRKILSHQIHDVTDGGLVRIWTAGHYDLVDEGEAIRLCLMGLASLEEHERMGRPVTEHWQRGVRVPNVYRVEGRK